MDTFTKIASAALLALMIVFLLPRAKQMLAASRPGTADDWRGFLLPVLGVVGFVLFLMWLV
jgi:hypothetical protein